MTLSNFVHICCKIKNVAIYTLYPEKFSVKNLAIRKVFAFSDSDLNQRLLHLRLPHSAPFRFRAIPGNSLKKISVLSNLESLVYYQVVRWVLTIPTFTSTPPLLT